MHGPLNVKFDDLTVPENITANTLYQLPSAKSRSPYWHSLPKSLITNSAAVCLLLSATPEHVEQVLIGLGAPHGPICIASKYVHEM